MARADLFYHSTAEAHSGYPEGASSQCAWQIVFSKSDYSYTSSLMCAFIERCPFYQELESISPPSESGLACDYLNE